METDMSETAEKSRAISTTLAGAASGSTGAK
jgi:hypothetical protein